MKRFAWVLLSLTLAVSPVVAEDVKSTAIAYCGSSGTLKYVSVFESADSLIVIGKIACNSRVSVLTDKPVDPGRHKVRTSDGLEGWVTRWFLKSNLSSPTTGQRMNQVIVLAYRSIPFQTTTYYNTPGSSSTTCTGQGQDFGVFTRLNLNCSTTSTPARSTPIVWSKVDNYLLVETQTQRMVVKCRANVRWSKCAYLMPNQSYPAQRKKGDLYITYVSFKGKRQTAKYGIIHIEPR